MTESEAESQCSVPGCFQPVRCRELCGLHYSRSRAGRPMEAPHQRRFNTAAERYEYFTDRSAGPNACWPWRGHCSPNRYGMITLDDGSKGSAHRYAYDAFNAPIPKGMLVLHRCDNKVCVNPAHLELGNNSDNLSDASARGLLPRGSRHHFAQLSEVDIPLIRAALESGESESSVASRFNVSRGAISHIRRGDSWAHIDRKGLSQ